MYNVECATCVEVIVLRTTVGGGGGFDYRGSGLCSLNRSSNKTMRTLSSISIYNVNENFVKSGERSSNEVTRFPVLSCYIQDTE